MLDEDNYQVIGRRHGRCYKLGYPVHIRVRKVDLIKKQIDFDLVEEEELTPSRKAKASNEKRPSGKTRESNKSQKKRKKR